MFFSSHFYLFFSDSLFHLHFYLILPIFFSFLFIFLPYVLHIYFTYSLLIQFRRG